MVNLLRVPLRSWVYTCPKKLEGSEKIVIQILRLASASLFSFVLTFSAYADPVCEIPSPNSGQINYAYDVLGRLTQVCYDNGRKVTYTFDEAGNRTEVIDTGAPQSVGVIVLPLGNGFFIIPVEGS